jgi:hypothetical protein
LFLWGKSEGTVPWLNFTETIIGDFRIVVYVVNFLGKRWRKERSKWTATMREKIARIDGWDGRLE